MDVNRIPNVDDVCWKLFRIVFWRFVVFHSAFLGIETGQIITKENNEDLMHPLLEFWTFVDVVTKQEFSRFRNR